MGSKTKLRALAKIDLSIMITIKCRTNCIYTFIWSFTSTATLCEQTGQSKPARTPEKTTPTSRLMIGLPTYQVEASKMRAHERLLGHSVALAGYNHWYTITKNYESTEKRNQYHTKRTNERTQFDVASFLRRRHTLIHGERHGAGDRLRPSLTPGGSGRGVHGTGNNHQTCIKQ